MSDTRNRLFYARYTFFLLFYLFTFFFSAYISASCLHTTYHNDVSKNIEINFALTAEDFSQNIYVLAWDDTLGNASGYTSKLLLKRPQEIWCTIANMHGDTLAYYYGMSMPRQHIGFICADTTVVVYFMRGYNMWTDLFDHIADKKKYVKEVMDYCHKHRLPVKYKPIVIHMQHDLRINKKIILEEK